VSTVEYLEAVKRLKHRQIDRAVAFSSILLGFEQVASRRRQQRSAKVMTGLLAIRKTGPRRHVALTASGIHGQFMIVICRVPPSFEGTVNFSTLRWHALVDDAGGAAGGG
jgi:hypothetical protein